MPRGRRGVRAAFARALAAPGAGCQQRANATWACSMAEMLARRIGPSPQREAIVGTLARALAPTTSGNYCSHLARFVAFCEAQPDRPSPLPATTDTVLRWLAGDVCARGAVQAGSLQPYLSAINRVHRDLGLDEPALGHLVQSYRSGLAHQQTDAGRPAERVYLPAAVLDRVMTWAIDADVRAGAVPLETFRAVVATVFTFCFFARGATGAQLLEEHVRCGPQGELLITLAHEKGKARRARARLITIPAGSVPGLDGLLAKWRALRGVVRPGDSFYALPSEVRRGGAHVRFASAQIDGWLQLVLARFGVSPPAGELWSGHSLRKGAASAAAAIGVSIDRICWCGGWSVHSNVVRDYIDPTCPADSAAYRFFGWLLPAAMRAATGFGMAT
jgi:hypothetical protein